MPVNKEFACPVHGYFESALPICVTCGNTDVKRVFVTPPAFKGDRTKLHDSELRQLTMQYGMTNYTNNENTKHTTDHSGVWHNPKEAIKTMPHLFTGGVNVNQTRDALKIMGGVTKIYDKRDVPPPK